MTTTKLSVLALSSAVAISLQGCKVEETPYTFEGQQCYPEQASTAYRATPIGSVGEASSATQTLVPCLSKSGYGSAEPTMAIKKDGTIFYGPAFTNDGNGIIRSADNGVSWDFLPITLPNGEDHSRVQPFLSMEPETERVFFHSSKLNTGGLDQLDFGFGFNMSWSDDNGASWGYTNVQMAAFDWGKVYAGPPVYSQTTGTSNVLYLSAPTPISTPAVIVSPQVQQVMRSLDNGESWHEVGGLSLRPSDNGCHALEWVIMGAGVVDPVDGTVYIGFRRCNRLGLGISHDEGMTWEVQDVPGAHLINYYTVLDVGLVNGNYVMGEPISIDSEGNLYAVWPDADDVLRMTISRDKGVSWSTPVVVSAPEVRSVRYGSLTVKEPGTVAIGYYGNIGGRPYHAMMAESTNAFDASPIFHGAIVNHENDPVYPIGFDPGYLGMFVGGDLNEIVQVRYGPNGDIFGTFNVNMCPDYINCTWDIDEKAASQLQGGLGRLIHQ
jgi:hypothetical protein